MSKIFSRIAAVAAVASVFVSCQAELDREVAPTKERITHVATVTLGKDIPEEDPQSRTAVVEGANEASYIWTEGDEQYLHVYENEVEGEILEINYSQDYSTATLSVGFSGTPTAPYSYRAVYAKTVDDGNLLIPDVQYPGADTASFDPAADVLISKASADVTNRTEPATSFAFTMGRVVTVNKMILTGLAEGEKVKKVEFTLDKPMSAHYVQSTGEYSSNASKLTLNYEENPVTVTSSGQVPVYFVSAPVFNAKIEGVVVTTNKTVYTKSGNTETTDPFYGKTISFAVGTMTRFGMNLEGYKGPVFYESFSGCKGKGANDDSWSGNIASSAFTDGSSSDNAGWVLESGYAADGCIKLGTSSNMGSATTPVLGIENGSATLKFKAAAWSGDATGLNISVVGNGVINIGNVTLANAAWTEYTVLIANADENTKIKFEAAEASKKNRFFLDEVKVYDGNDGFAPVLDAPTNVGAEVAEDKITVTWTDITAPAGETVTYSVTCTGQTAQVVAQGTRTATFENLADGIYEVSVTAVPSTSAYKNSNAVIVSYLIVNTSPEPVSGWVETALADLTSKDVFVIVGKKDSNYYAMSNDKGTSAAPAATSVTLSGSKLSAVPADNLKWNISRNATTGYTFYPNGSTTTWLYCTNTNNGVRVGTNDNKTFTLNNGYLYNSGTSRYVGVYESQDWRCYTSTSTNITGQTFKFYKEVTTSGTVTALPSPGNLEAVDVDGDILVTWDSVTGADSYTVTCTGQQTKTGLTTCEATFSGLDSGTYTVTVTAISDDKSVRLDSEPSSTEVTVASAGTEANPYTVAQAITAISALASNTQPATESYVTGIISRVALYYSNYNSISYYISDDGAENDELFIYSGKGLNNVNFSSLSDLTAGDKVTVKGFLYNYNGSTPELNRNNYIVSIVHQASASVTTGSTSSVQSTQATLSASFSGASGRIYETGFYYGSSSSNLNSKITGDGTNNASGSFSLTVTGLSESSTYYYKAYVLEYNAVSQQYEKRFGSVSSFTTASSSTTGQGGYLSCYEVPDVSGILSGTGTSGSNTSRDDIWYRYNTNNSKRQIAVHTFTHPTYNRKVRNYTVLFDGDNYAPLWTAHAMHSDMWLDNNAGRSDNWTTDPAISLTQQTGLDNANDVGYSRGHLVASNYRQSSVGQNAQTFYYTNQAPQWQDGFNSGVWSSLEGAVVSHAPSGRDTLYVVTGVLYEGTITTRPSGNLNVRIPSHFYKCLMKCSFNESGTITAASGVAYIFTNESHSGGHYYDSAYVTTIDAIEARAGFDFFPNVPADKQAAAESSSTPLWQP